MRIKNDLLINWGVPLLLVLLTLILRILFLGGGSITGDEPFTIYHAQFNVSEIIDLLSKGNNPPLFEILLHYWIDWFGASPFSIRFLPMIFNVLSVWFLYQLALKFFNFRVAVFASFFFALSTFQVFFAHEIRVYSLFQLLTIVSMWALWNLKLKPTDKRFFVLLTLTNIMLIYSHYFGFVVLLVQVLSVVGIKALRLKLLKVYLLSGLIVGISFIPYLGLIVNRYVESSEGTWLQAPEWVELYNLLWEFSNAPVVTVVCLLLLLGAVIMFLIRREKRAFSSFLKITLIWFFLPYFGMFLISFELPVFLPRYQIFIAPAYVLLVAIALDYLVKDSKIYFAVMSVVVVAMAVTVKLETHNDGSKEFITEFKEKKKEGIPVIIMPEWTKFPVAYYYDHDVFFSGHDLVSKLNEMGFYPVYSPDELPANLLDQKQIYLLTTPGYQNEAKQKLGSRMVGFNVVETEVLDKIYHLELWSK